MRTLQQRPDNSSVAAPHCAFAKISTIRADCYALRAELLLPRPLFAGSTEAEQIELIAKVFGAPSEENMPGLSK